MDQTMPNSSLRHGRGIARRQFITGASALAAMATLPATPRAQADTLFDPIIPPQPTAGL